MAEPPAKRIKTILDDHRADQASHDSTSSRAASPVQELNSPSRTPQYASPAQRTQSSSQMPLSSPPSANYQADDLVTLIVGPEKEKFIVHGHRLAETSVFFQAALKKEWKEGKSRVIELPEEDADHTKYYLDFVYGGALPSNDLQDEEKLSLEKPFVLLFDLYLFAERMLNKPMRNAIIEETIRLMSLKDVNGNGWFPDWESAASIYQRTISTSMNRYFLVDILVRYGQPRWLECVDMRGCTDLLVDVVMEFNNRAMKGFNPMYWRGKALCAERYFG